MLQEAVLNLHLKIQSRIRPKLSKALGKRFKVRQIWDLPASLPACPHCSPPSLGKWERKKELEGPRQGTETKISAPVTTRGGDEMEK